MRDYYAEECDRLLKPSIKRLAKAGLTASPQRLVGHPGEEISALAEREKADLIVMGSHGHSALHNLVAGSVTSNVLARTRIPLLVLRKREAPEADALKVGIAIDGSKYGREAVKYVVRHADLFGAAPELTLIYVASDFAGALMPDMAGIALPAFSVDDIEGMQKKAFEIAVAPARKLLAKGKIVAKEACLIGNPGDELADYATRKKLDLLVMGSHGYGAFKAAVLGSTTRRVLAHSKVPLLVVRRG